MDDLEVLIANRCDRGPANRFLKNVGVWNLVWNLGCGGFVFSERLQRNRLFHTQAPMEFAMELGWSLGVELRVWMAGGMWSLGVEFGCVVWVWSFWCGVRVCGVW